jgi:enoyl-CoA hydratase
MSDPALRVEVDDGVALVTIDRPERRNAMSRDAWIEFRDVVGTLRRDGAARGLILTGAGDRVFAAGADVRELVDRDPAVALDGLVQGILTELEDLPVPTVAALNGHALGGGWEMALACDLRVAAEGARVGFPEVGLGILPGAGGTQRVLQHVGLGRAKELVLSGRILDASEALELGLVNRVVEKDRVLETARQLLAAMLEQSPAAVRLAKTVLNATARGRTSWELERLAYTLSFHSPDREERMRAFLERRSSGSPER